MKHFRAKLSFPIIKRSKCGAITSIMTARNNVSTNEFHPQIRNFSKIGMRNWDTNKSIFVIWTVWTYMYVWTLNKLKFDNKKVSSFGNVIIFCYFHYFHDFHYFVRYFWSFPVILLFVIAACKVTIVLKQKLLTLWLTQQIIWRRYIKMLLYEHKWMNGRILWWPLKTH